MLVNVCLDVAAIVWLLLCHSPRHPAQAEAAVDHWPFSHLSASATFFLLSVIPSSILTGKVLLVFLFAYFAASGFLITHENK